MHTEIKTKNILLFVYSFLLFNVGLVKLRFESITNILLLFTFLITFFLCIVNFQIIINLEIVKYVPILLVYAVLVLISALLNKDNYISSNAVSSTFKYLILIFSVFFGFSLLFRLQEPRLTMKILFYLSILYCFINDILCLPRINSLKITQTYFLGNKFTVALTHTITLALFCGYYILRNRADESRCKFLYVFWCLSIYALLADIMVDCFTGIVGLAIFIFTYFVFRKKLYLSFVPWLIVFIVTSLVPYFYEKIMNSQIYQSFFIDKLGRSITMTGRMNIYKQIPYFMFNHWQWGYGYGTSYSVVETLIGMPDTQNGTLELILQTGIYATSIFVIFVIFLFYRTAKNDSKVIVPFISIIYVLTIDSAFEITYSFEFIAACAIIIALLNLNTYPKKRQI